MCWNIQSSFITWVIGLVAGLILLRRKEMTLGLLVLVYSSMQLWEAMMWYDQKCGKINLVGTKLAYFALWSHVLAIGVGLYLEQQVVLPLFVGLAFIAAGLVTMPTSWDCSVPGKNGHLAWGFDPYFYLYVFSFAILICLLYIRPFAYSVLVSLLFLTSFAFAYWYGTPKNPAEKSVTGSFWCWVCAAFAVLFVVFPRHPPKHSST